MKAKVIIEEGKAIIELTPGTAFEESLLEDVDSLGAKYEITSAIRTDTAFGVSSRKLVIEMVEKTKQVTRG